MGGAEDGDAPEVSDGINNGDIDGSRDLQGGGGLIGTPAAGHNEVLDVNGAGEDIIAALSIEGAGDEVSRVVAHQVGVAEGEGGEIPRLPAGRGDNKVEVVVGHAGRLAVEVGDNLGLEGRDGGNLAGSKVVDAAAGISETRVARATSKDRDSVLARGRS